MKVLTKIEVENKIQGEVAGPVYELISALNSLKDTTAKVVVRHAVEEKTQQVKSLEESFREAMRRGAL